MVSSMQCFGETASTRSCIFRNVLLTKEMCLEFSNPMGHQLRAGMFSESSTFSLETRPASSFVWPKFLIQANVDYYGGPFLEWPKSIFSEKKPFCLRARGELNTSGVRTEEGATLLWNFHEFSGASYGHCMLNDVYPMHVLLQNHGMSLSNVSVIPIRGSIPRLCIKYLAGAIRGVSTIESDVFFRMLIVGEGGYWKSAHDLVHIHQARFPSTPTIYTSHGWKSLRDIMYAMYNLSGNACDLRISHFQITINKQKDRRKIKNLDDVVLLLSNISHVKVKAVDFTILPVEEQFRSLQETQIFITTQGSSATRLAFLPDHSRVIVIGSGKDQWIDISNSINYTPFHEIPRYFPLQYVRLIKYPVPLLTRTDDLSHWDIYNKDVVVDASRLRNYVTQGIREIKQILACHRK